LTFHTFAHSDCLRGTFKDQKTVSSKLDRFYLLNVPTSWDCHTPIPLVVDMHGFAGGEVNPEEQYALAGAIEFSNREQVLLVRPRSRFTYREGVKSFYWDAGGTPEIDLNIQFIRDLVTEMSQKYTIDTKKLYAMGFSNGSNMTVQLMQTSSPKFAGYAVIGGGMFDPISKVQIDPKQTRIYIADGTKDLLTPFKWSLIQLLADQGFDLSQLLDRITSSGHRLSAWHYEDLWNWFQTRDQTPDAVPENWSVTELKEAGPILAIKTDSKGQIYASTANGQIWRNSGGENWEKIYSSDSPTPLLGLCIRPNGEILAAGNNTVITSDAQGSAFRSRKFVTGTWAWANDLICNSDSILLSTFPLSYYGSDIDSLAPSQGNSQMDVFATSFAKDGSIYQVGGYGSLAISRDQGRTFEIRYSPVFLENWIYSVAQSGDVIWGAGEGGMIYQIHPESGKIDPSATSGKDFYTIAFSHDAVLGVAAGRFGSIFVTQDGGANWQDRSVPLNASFSSSLATNKGEIYLGNERGQIWKSKPK
jgi:predicted esterase/photosystem II stability/assembly factor-like uncharacterized protein